MVAYLSRAPLSLPGDKLDVQVAADSASAPQCARGVGSHRPVRQTYLWYVTYARKGGGRAARSRRYHVGERNQVKSIGCVRGGGVRGVPVLRVVARIEERHLAVEASLGCG